MEKVKIHSLAHPLNSFREIPFCLLPSAFCPLKAPPRFLLLFPNLFGFKGGIQVYSGFLLRALLSLYPEASIDVLLKYDRPTDIEPSGYGNARFRGFGRWPRWLQSLLLTVYCLILGLRERPTLAIATHVNYGIACYLLKRLTGIPYWVVVHGLEAWEITHPLLRVVLQEADRVVAVSRYTRSRLLLEQSLDPEKCCILPNTFEASRFEMKPKPSYLLERYGLHPDQLGFVPL